VFYLCPPLAHFGQEIPVLRREQLVEHLVSSELRHPGRNLRIWEQAAERVFELLGEVWEWLLWQ